jgi:hypothetical protein
VVEPAPELEPTVALPPEPPAEVPLEPTVALPPEPPPDASPVEPAPPETPGPSFEPEPPPPTQFDTLPGDQPAHVPPAGVTGGVEPGSSSRPTKEDLAALDALLNPSAADGAEKPSPRTRSETWEPQFRTGTTAPRRAAVGRRTSPSRAPVIGGAVVLVLVVAAAAYYFLFARSTEPAAATAPPTAAPTMEPTPNLSAPATTAAVPEVTPTPAPRATPTAPAPTPTPLAAAVPAATPVPTPPPTQAAPPPTGNPQSLLRQGAYDDAARGFAASLAAGPPGRYGIQALVACSPETVTKAVQSVTDDALFILPVNYQGRDCHRICWGVYPDRAAAEAAARSFPAYFRQNGIRPRIQPLPDLLP